MTQQAVLQVLAPIFDPEFSDASYGFRPGWSAHDAVYKVREYIKEGYRIAVDMDLSKFFDTVNHDVLMHRVARRIKDKRVLTLIGKYLRAVWCSAAAAMLPARAFPKVVRRVQTGLRVQGPGERK
jgi:RNA-directed DNA polymerase